MDNQDKNIIDDLDDFQYEDIYYESDEPLVNIATRTIKSGFVVGLFLFVIIVLAGIFIKIPIERNFNFILKNSENEIVYRYIDFITIEELFVEANDKIEKGDTLAIISSEKISSYINNYKNSTNKLNNFYYTDTLIYKYKVSSLYDKLILLEKSILAKQQTIDLIKKQKLLELKNLTFISKKSKHIYQIDKELHEKDALSNFKLEESKGNKIRDETYKDITLYKYEEEITKESMNVNETKIQIEIIKKEIQILKNELIKKQNELKNELEYNYTVLKTNYKNFIISNNNKLILLSPHKGIVSFVADKSEEKEEKEVFLKIINNKSKIYAQIEVEPYEIGYLRSKLPAILKISTFPFYEWGIVKASISNITKSTNEKGNYLVKLNIIDFGNLRDKLNAGMVGKTSILTNEKTMFELIFEKIIVSKENFEN